jgi:subtilisin family serine protease
VVVIAPSGNEGATKLDIPASYPHVLSVGATDESGLRADFSNSGFGLDMAAPGADIWSAAPTSVCPSGYTYSSGTSFAAPAVSGAAALLAALRPDLDASQVIEMLRRGAGQSAWSPGLGFGLLNIPAVLAAPVPPAQPREVDDDVYWVKRAPLSLSPKRRRTSVDGSVAARLDPTDVYPVQLRAGDILRASVNSAGAPLRLGLWDRRTGSFDITDGRLQHRVSSGPVLRRRVRKGGTYYVSVAAPAKSPVTTPYKLSLSR